MPAPSSPSVRPVRLLLLALCLGAARVPVVAIEGPEADCSDCGDAATAEEDGPTGPLYQAAAKGDLAQVKALITSGDPAVWGEQGERARVEFAAAIAAYKGQVEVVEWCLGQGVKMDAGVRNDNTLLHWAAAAGQERMAAWLLDHGAAVGPPDMVGATPLHMAAVEGHERMVRLLLTRGANADAATDNGQRPVHRAAMACNLPCLRRLVEAGADLGALDHDGSRVWEYLYSSNGGDAGENLIPVMEFLQSKEVELDPASATARGMLVDTIQSDNLPATRWLLDHGVSATLADEEDAVPLDYTSTPAMVRLLQHHGAELSTSANAVEVMFRDAAERGDLAAFDQLLKDGFAPSYDVFAAAAAAGRLEVVKRMEALGMDPAAVPVDEDGEVIGEGVPAVTAAAQAETTAVLAHFLESGAADARDPALLAAAAATGRAANIRLLLAKGADVNAAPDSEDGGLTPLQVAATNGHAEAVAALLAAGAKRDAKDSDGQTPLDLARENGSEAVVKLLEAK